MNSMQDIENNYDNLLDESNLTNPSRGSTEDLALVEKAGDGEVAGTKLGVEPELGAVSHSSLTDDTGSESAFEEIKDTLEHFEQLKKENDRLKRQTYSQLEQIRKEKEEVNRLAQLFSNSFDNNIASVEQKFEDDLEKAKQKAASFIDENGAILNAAEYQNANLELMRLQNEVLQFESWKENEAPKHKPVIGAEDEQGSNRAISGLRERALADWIKSKPVLDESSNSFDPNFATHTALTAKALDEELYSSNQAHLIGSPDYLALMDEWMSSQFKPVYKDRNLSLRNTRPMYAGAGNASTGRLARNQLKLNAVELDFAKAIGVNPKDFAEA